MRRTAPTSLAPARPPARLPWAGTGALGELSNRRNLCMSVHGASLACHLASKRRMITDRYACTCRGARTCGVTDYSKLISYLLARPRPSAGPAPAPRRGAQPRCSEWSNGRCCRIDCSTRPGGRHRQASMRAYVVVRPRPIRRPGRLHPAHTSRLRKRVGQSLRKEGRAGGNHEFAWPKIRFRISNKEESHLVGSPGHAAEGDVAARWGRRRGDLVRRHAAAGGRVARGW